MIVVEPKKVKAPFHALGTEHAKILLPHVSRCFIPWWERDEPLYEPFLFDNQVEWIWHWKYEEGTYVKNIYGDVSGSPQRVQDFFASKEDLRKWAKSVPVKRIVGALHGWHQLNSKQLCAFTGIDPKNLTRYTTPLFQAGILERGRYVMPNRNENRNQLWKLHYGEFYKKFVKELKVADYYNLTYGQTSKGSLPHERHNVTTAEMMLRWHEIADVFQMQGCSPERLNDPKLMIPGFDSKFKQKADAGIVRYDGLRILFETTNSVNYQHLKQKMLKWVETLSGPYSETGIHVVFVNCSPYHHEDLARMLRKVHAVELTPEKTGLDPDVHRRAVARISIASYKDWFPARFQVSYEFMKLSSIRRKGDSANPDDWVSIDLFGKNHIKFEGSDNIDWQVPSCTLPHLFSTPVFYREEKKFRPERRSDG